MHILSSDIANNPDKIHKKKKEFFLKNAFLSITLSSIGASVKNIRLLLSDKKFKNIALALLLPDDAPRNSLYAGATLAPAAGRIQDGILTIDGVSYQLTKNENHITHLHGGEQNLSFSDWDVLSSTDSSVSFRSFLPDGADGYPGNRYFYTTYTLKDSSLMIHMRAQSDKKTWFNMSNHTYFNLNAFSLPGLEQYLQINADTVILNNAIHIPVKKQDVASTLFDFRKPMLLSGKLQAFASDENAISSKGFNHYFILKKTEAENVPDCTLLSADQKVSMELFTDAPAIVFYSGGFIDGQYSFFSQEKTMKTYPGCAIALEASELPLHFIDFHGQTEFERTVWLKFAAHSPMGS